MKKYFIPRTLDDPPMFYFVEGDTAMVAMICGLFALLLQSFILLVVAFFVTRGFVYLKAVGGKGLLVRLIYWYLPSGFIAKRAPSYIRHISG